MKKFALLIGVSEYGVGLHPLKGSLKDIEALHSVLVDPEIGDFHTENVKRLANPKRQQMEDAIFELFTNLGKSDLALLYFSGHGIKDGRSTFFLGASDSYKTAQGELHPASAVRASFVQEQLTGSRSRQKVVILDACFSGAFAVGLTAKDDGSVRIKEQMGGEGRAILTSSSSIQYSLEQEEEALSIYTRYLVEGIQTGAADANEDGHVSVDELHEYVRRKVAEEAPTMTPEIYPSKEGYAIRLSKAPIGDPKLKYRKEVERRINNGRLSKIASRILQKRQIELSISADEAKKIQASVLEPFQKYQDNLREYEEAFKEAIEEFNGVFSNHTCDELQEFQLLLSLRDEDVRRIEAVQLSQNIAKPVAVKVLPSIACPVCTSINNSNQDVCAVCGTSLPPSPLTNETSYKLLEGVLLCNDRYCYCIEEQIGEGGYSIIYRGIDLDSSKKVAIKELWPEKAGRQGSLVVWPSSISDKEKRYQLDKFQLEAKYQSQCSHSAIAEVYNQFEQNGTAYIVMELIEGKTLYEIFKAEGVLSTTRVRKYFGQVGAALGAIHAHNFLHRDIKPDNIIINAQDNAVLIDFGSTREYIAGQTREMTVILTKGYAPLEQYSYKSKRWPATDLYALCASMYALLTGESPTEAVLRVQNEPLIPPRQKNPAIDPSLERLILTGMEMKVEDRLQDAQQFLLALSGRFPKSSGQF